MNFKNAAHNYYDMIETIMDTSRNTNATLIKTSYFYRLYFKTTIYMFLLFYRLGTGLNYKPFVSFAISILINSIKVLKKIQPYYCSMFKEKPILKNIEHPFLHTEHSNPVHSLSNYDKKKVNQWKKNSARNLDDALKLVSYEKHKNRKVKDILGVWSNIHNKQFIPYVLKDIVGIRSFSEITEIINYILSYDKNIISILVTIILTSDICKLDELLSQILNKMDTYHQQLKFDQMQMKIIGPYRYLLDGKAKGLLDSLINSKRKIDFDKYKKGLIEVDRELIKKLNIFVLCNILLSKYIILYLDTVKDKLEPDIESLSKHYIKNSIKFIEDKLIDDTIYGDFLQKDNSQKTINSLKYMIKKIDVSSVKIGSFTENLIWNIFSHLSA